MGLTPLAAMKQARSRRCQVAGTVVAAAIFAAILQPARAHAQAAPPTACDTAASFAYDPQRVAPGVGYDAINAPFAIPQCAQAVRFYPASGRLHFEFGRALEKGGRLPRAIAAYERAARLGHGGGFNNLGELYRAGKGVPRDLSMAQREFEQGAALGYPEAQYNLANLLVDEARTDANIERARQLLTSALNAGYVDASASLRALPSKASPMPWSTRGWSVPATGTAVATPEQRATPAPVSVAQTSAPTANPVLAKVLTPRMLDIQVPYLETIVGPAMRLTKLQHDLELRTYQVGDCELLAYAKGSTVSAYGLRIKAGCAADLSQFIQRPVSVAADATFGGLADALGGANGTYQSACIYECGNAADPRVEWTWEGSNAQSQIKVQLAVTLVAPDSLNAATVWQNAMLSRESQHYVASAHFNCDGKYQQEASSAFRSVRVTELFVGHGESMDDQDVAMACPSSKITVSIGQNLHPATGTTGSEGAANKILPAPPTAVEPEGSDYSSATRRSLRYAYCVGYIGGFMHETQAAGEFHTMQDSGGKIMKDLLAYIVSQPPAPGMSQQGTSSESTSVINRGRAQAVLDHTAFEADLQAGKTAGETSLLIGIERCAKLAIDVPPNPFNRDPLPQEPPTYRGLGPP